MLPTNVRALFCGLGTHRDKIGSCSCSYGLWEREEHRNQGINKNTEMVSRDPQSGEQGAPRGLGGESSRKCSALGQQGACVSRTSWESRGLKHGSKIRRWGAPSHHAPLQVDIEINGEPVDLHMKLGDSGEAFFIQELESDVEDMPPHLCTSPIPWGGLSGFPSDSHLGTAREPEASIAGTASTGWKKKRRRRKPRQKEDTVAADSSSEELEAGTGSERSLLEKPRPEPPGSVQPEGEASPQPKDIYPYSDGERPPQASLSTGGLTSPKSDSELELRTPEPIPLRAESHMQWAWGRLPKVGNAEWPASSVVPDGSSKTASPPQGAPSTPSASVVGVDPSGIPILQTGPGTHLLHPDTEVPALVGPPLQPPEREETKTQSSGDVGLPPPSESWSWAALEAPACTGQPEGISRRKEKFNQHIVSYQDLAQNPGLLDDPNLVVKINEKHYNWAVAASMILSLQAFQKNLPKSTVDKLEKEKMPRKGGRWWFSWRCRDFPAKECRAQREKTTARQQQLGEKTEAPSSEDDAPASPILLEAPSPPLSPPAHTPTYKKSLRLSSNQIRRLNLQEGANEVVFSVTTQYQGTCRCRATIYLWKWDDRVIISDIDGTITKSDVLGHILPQLGKDWTHQGITSLYHKIHLNGYKFLYCSARAIGMADLTKGYLQWVSERGCGLPEGPILLSPSSLFSALHREVIEKKPEVFKIACLSDIQQLFLPQKQPFYAAFGNRPNDVTAYRQVGLPTSRIFTVNPRGELSQEFMKNHKSTYERLGEVAELFFPPVARGPSTDLASPEYSNFCYWREPLAPVDLDTLA
ncbi:phosphatidate phosphatase LPIN3 isoform X8 [Lagenorhynchus albirostris]|uniref:phosphatidate phosphatase LPIN3 isoform X8 n=1 Tax=Lagenorhynchus albirostris TaxID=27610 RepID=UPI0028E41D55|nr:phosphatidate phosphatase LPIN3 isoform X8 [Lagenorhynchus albirostris]